MTLEGGETYFITIGFMFYVGGSTLMVTWPLPVGKYPGFTSTMDRWIFIADSRGMSPNLTDYRGGDLLTSVPPFMMISGVYCRPVQMGTRHCIIRVQLAAVEAFI